MNEDQTANGTEGQEEEVIGTPASEGMDMPTTGDDASEEGTENGGDDEQETA